MEVKKVILRACMERGFLLDKEMLELFSDLDEKSAEDLISAIDGVGVEERVINKVFFSKNFERIQKILVNGESKLVIDKFFFNLGYSRSEVDSSVIDVSESEEQEKGSVKILSNPVFLPRKVVVGDFVKYFRDRYNSLRQILQQRDLEKLTSLRKIGSSRENCSVIVYILKKRITKNKNLILEVEDLTGQARILVNQNKKELFDKCRELLLDDVVAFSVSGNDEWLFANDVFFPDAFLHEKRKGNVDEYVAFTSDLHLGSTMFLEDYWLKFVRWLNGEEGSEEQRDLARKVRYLLIVGDSVDGVGVYPGQESLLNVKDAKGQYHLLAEHLKMIRKDIKIVICPGQHDAVWVGHPQPVIDEVWAEELCEMENVLLVPNPALIEIDGGFKILMYHGAGMHAFVEEIEDIRLNYGHHSPARVVREVLKRRHLNPSHGSADYIPTVKDELVVRELPDIVATGDWHRAEVGNYNGILTIASSCWQSTTPFEEKVGHEPDPGKVPLFNLKTREIKIMDFSEGEKVDSANVEGEKVGMVQGVENA